MFEIPTILKAINANGTAVAAVALVLLVGIVYQGCNYRDCRVERDAYERLYKQQLNETLSWQTNAMSWEKAANECSATTRQLQQAALREQGVLMRELRTARAEREVSKARYNDLKRRVEDGSISVRELLQEVQGI